MRLSSHRYYLCLLSLVLSCASSFVMAEDLLQIFKAVQENDPAWKASEYAYQSSKQAKGIGRAYMLPNLTVNGEHQQVTDKPDCASGDPLCAEREYESTSYQAQLTQPLFNMESWRNYQAGRANFTLAEIEYQNAYQNNLYDTAVLYFDVLRAQETYLLALAEQNALATQLKEITAKAEAGVSDQTEVIETQASADLATVNHITELGYLKVAFEKLVTHTGIEKPTVMSLSADYPIQHLVPFDEQLWLNKAKASSNNLKAMQQSIEIAEQNYKRNTSAIYPKIDLFATVSDRDSEAAFVQSGSNEAIGIRATVPLFVGLGDFYTAKEQKMKFLQTSEEIEAQKREFLQIVKNRFRSIYTDVLTVEARKKSLHSSERALKAVKAQYELGSRDMIDVLNAQKQMFASQREYANARYNYLLDLLQLKLFVGELTLDDLKEVNSWLVVDNNLMNLDTLP